MQRPDHRRPPAMKAPDTLAIEHVHTPENVDARASVHRVKLVVNGIDFLDTASAFELQHKRAEGWPNPEKEPRTWPLANKNTVRSLRGFSDYPDGKSALAGCHCGNFDCWPLVAKIVRTSTTVTWKRLENYHRSGCNKFQPWPYERLGPFVFDRRSYDRVIAGIA